MKDFLELIKTRRSIRKFKDSQIDEGTLNNLINSALLSPSSRSLAPLEFIIVTEKELLKKLSKAKHGAALLKNAPLGIVVCANPSISDVWIEDASIASAFLLLQAHDNGLGACWIQIRNREYNNSKTAGQYVSEILSIPPELKVESIIAIGYPDEKKEAYKIDDLNLKKVYKNGYK